jgi:hypothetical protein
MNKTRNPYTGLPRAQFWRRSVSTVERHLLDPVVSTKFTIGKDQKVATAGSCFAQHIARKLQATGFNYFVAEQPQGMSPEQARTMGYGVFSARYGNIYTARQLLQLYERAHGRFAPLEDHWLRPDGRFADPYRPNVEPGGFASLEALHDDRAVHLQHVRAMFRETDFFIFTLGLTEGWRSRRDGAVFPLAPGVTAGEYDESLHEFVNFDVAETIADFRSFLAALRAINPRIRVLLTVSPVPLIATYESTHVLTATTYSKSVLRVAADTLARELEWVDYFPSFEIITGSFNAGAYYQADAREVTDAGVAHVMRCFARHYLSDDSALGKTSDGAGELESAAAVRSRADIVCDEEAIDQIID